jgi:hypothetical protein
MYQLFAFFFRIGGRRADDDEQLYSNFQDFGQFEKKDGQNDAYRIQKSVTQLLSVPLDFARPRLMQYRRGAHQSYASLAWV